MRTLKPGFFENDELAALPFQTRILFAGLWCYCDRKGRCEDRPKRIKAAVFPYDTADIPKMLDALEAAGFIRRYTVGVMKLIHIKNFLHHQRPHKNEQESDLPEPPVHGTTMVVPEHNQGSAMDAQSLGVRTVVGTGTPENMSPPSGAPVSSVGAEKSNGHGRHPEAKPLCEYLSRALGHWKPDALSVRSSVADASVNDMDRMLRIDSRDASRARELIDWVFADEDWSFHPRGTFDWRPNIQSGGALRKHWDRLDNECRIALTNERDRL